MPVIAYVTSLTESQQYDPTTQQPVAVVLAGLTFKKDDGSATYGIVSIPRDEIGVDVQFQDTLSVTFAASAPLATGRGGEQQQPGFQQPQYPVQRGG
jgi:hypothetical protein